MVDVAIFRPKKMRSNRYIPEWLVNVVPSLSSSVMKTYQLLQLASCVKNVLCSLTSQ